MSHTYTNTMPARTIDRIGLLKQITDSELDAHERQVLSAMVTFCQLDGTLPFKAFNGQTLGDKLKLSSSTVGRVLQRLKEAKLLTKVAKRGRMHWVLPTEESVAMFNPKRK